MCKSTDDINKKNTYILPVSSSSSELTKDADGADRRDFTPLLVALDLSTLSPKRVDLLNSDYLNEYENLVLIKNNQKQIPDSVFVIGVVSTFFLTNAEINGNSGSSVISPASMRYLLRTLSAICICDAIGRSRC